MSATKALQRDGRILQPSRCAVSRPLAARLPVSWRSHTRRVLAESAPNEGPASTLPSSISGTDAASVPVPTSEASASSAATAAPQWRWEESDDAVQAYALLLGILAAGQLPILTHAPLSDLPYFIGLACTTIYIGAHRGLTARSRQQLSMQEGLLAPVAASVSLFGVYLLLKLFPDFNIQMLLNAYFWLLGSFAIGTAAVPLLRRVSGPLGSTTVAFKVPQGLLIDETGADITDVTLAPSDFAAVALALGLATAELASGHTSFSLNNLIACLVATDILQLLGLRSFRTAAVLLLGLLAYDVFWVFGSPKVIGDNVMLAVATSDVVIGPTRLLFPRIPGGMGEAANFPFSLLGLGDIAIPGLLACLSLRYDASRSTDMRARASAAAEAINDALAALEPSASSKEIADAAASAADLAYDRVADEEVARRDATLDGTHNGRDTSSSTSSSAASITTDGAGGGYRSASSTMSNSGGTDGTAALSAPGRVQASDAVLQQRAYFTPVIGAYVLGLLMAFGANEVTHLGQPALLYIVPCTLSAVALTAMQRGELSRIWSFTDAPTFGIPEAVRTRK